MAENLQPDPPAPSFAFFRKRTTLSEKEENKKRLDKERAKTRVNIGVAFDRWRELRERKGLKTDAMVATFLLNRYEKYEKVIVLTSTPSHRLALGKPPPPPVSTVVSETMSERDDFSIAGVEELEKSPILDEAILQLDASMSSLDLTAEINADDFNDIRNSTIDWEDDTWYPHHETQSISASEEDITKEVDTDYSSDEDYVPPICVRSGGALKNTIALDSLPTISVEETVHDLSDNTLETATADVASIPETTKVLVADDIIGHRASISYHDSLKQLAEFLVLPVDTCDTKDPASKVVCKASKPFEVTVMSRGTAAVVDWICPQGHTVWKWNSQANLKYGMQAGDFMLATNILLSGNSYSKISLLFKFMNMGMVEKSTFFRIQDSYCVDAIKEFWTEKQKEVISHLKSREPIVVLGDARMDSPGFSAQFCTYTTMENDSKKIIHMENIDKRETMRNSVVMEKEGFIRTLECLQKEIRVAEICTDAHQQISALFNKGKYKDSGVLHTLDIWHGSKNLSKRIHAAGLKKDCSILHLWNKDICNHFWYCCKMAEQYEDFFDLWIGLLHHVTGKHVWALGACRHEPLVDSAKEHIRRGSVAHQALAEVIMDVRWLKNVHKFLQFRSTAELESFHNHILMYASKRFSFTPPVYAARTMLAGLDYNYHLDRPAKRKADGSIQYCKSFNKKSKKWSLYTMRVEKDYGYIVDLQRAILQRRLLSSGGLPRRITLRPGDPRQHGLVSGVPAPTTQELQQTQISRGSGEYLPTE